MQAFETIKIESHLCPISLYLHPYEFESNFPSFHCQVTGTVKHPTGRFIYEASDIWFGTEDFDRFTSDLSSMVNGTQNRARLQDLSNLIAVEIVQGDRKTSIVMNIVEPDPAGAETQLQFKADTDLGLPASLLSTLREFDRWW